MMTSPDPLFAHLQADDDQLAAEVAERLGMTLPEACVTGVAVNARLLQQHLDRLRDRPA